MKNKSSKIKSSVDEIISLFHTDPEDAYELLIHSNHYFYSGKAIRFWEAFNQLDLDKLIEQNSGSNETFKQVISLKQFHDLNAYYKNERIKHIKEIIELNPEETSLIKSLFLCLELGEGCQNPFNFVNYSEDSLTAIKVILNEVLRFLKKANKSSYSIELAQVSFNSFD